MNLKKRHSPLSDNDGLINPENMPRNCADVAFPVSFLFYVMAQLYSLIHKFLRDILQLFRPFVRRSLPHEYRV